jgi:putative tryptophan/tyrosine transport system substrate-binding protein
MMRRELVSLLCLAATVWQPAAHAQQSSLPVIGFLGAVSVNEYTIRLEAFRQGLKDLGFVEGQNVTVEYRWAEGHNERLPALAAELARHQVSVIVAGGGTASAIAAKAATSIIPIVTATAVDPVAIGLAASLRRPGGNLTGVTNFNAEMGPKRVELVRELIPKAAVVALLVNQTNPGIVEPFTRETKAAASSLGLQLYILQASAESDF